MFDRVLIAPISTWTCDVKYYSQIVPKLNVHLPLGIAVALNVF